LLFPTKRLHPNPLNLVGLEGQPDFVALVYGMDRWNVAFPPKHLKAVNPSTPKTGVVVNETNEVHRRGIAVHQFRHGPSDPTRAIDQNVGFILRFQIRRLKFPVKFLGKAGKHQEKDQKCPSYWNDIERQRPVYTEQDNKEHEPEKGSDGDESQGVWNVEKAYRVPIAAEHGHAGDHKGRQAPDAEKKDPPLTFGGKSRKTAEVCHDIGCLDHQNVGDDDPYMQIDEALPVDGARNSGPSAPDNEEKIRKQILLPEIGQIVLRLLREKGLPIKFYRRHVGWIKFCLVAEFNLIGSEDTRLVSEKL